MRTIKLTATVQIDGMLARPTGIELGDNMVDLSVTRLDVVRRRVGKGPGEGLVLEHLLTARGPPVQFGVQRKAPWGTSAACGPALGLTPLS